MSNWTLNYQSKIKGKRNLVLKYKSLKLKLKKCMLNAFREIYPNLMLTLT